MDYILPKIPDFVGSADPIRVSGGRARPQVDETEPMLHPVVQFTVLAMDEEGLKAAILAELRRREIDPDRVLLRITPKPF